MSSCVCCVLVLVLCLCAPAYVNAKGKHKPVPPESSCALLSGTLAPFCVGIVDWKVPGSMDQHRGDQLARFGNEMRGGCSYFTARAFQCRKHFPKCTLTLPPDTNTSDSADVVVSRVCEYSCFKARAYNNGECEVYNDEYFQDECENREHFGVPPSCYEYEYDWAMSSADFLPALVLTTVMLFIIVSVSRMARLARLQRAGQSVDHVSRMHALMGLRQSLQRIDARAEEQAGSEEEGEGGGADVEGGGGAGGVVGVVSGSRREQVAETLQDAFDMRRAENARRGRHGAYIPLRVLNRTIARDDDEHV